MFQSVGHVADPHASLLTLSRTNAMGVTASSGVIQQDAADHRWDCSDDDDEYVERLVIDVDASLGNEHEYSNISSASEDRGHSHLQEILQTGTYTGRCEYVFKQNTGASKEKKIKPTSEEKSKKERAPLTADQIQKTLNTRADDYMRNNFMQYRAANVENFKAEGKLSCDSCDRTFKFKSNLCRHKKHAHTDAQPHRSGLIAHADVHADDKPFGCELCPRRFAYRSNLGAHARVHAGHKPHACNVCDAKFTRKFILTAHQRTHTGEKPYACHICERKYSNKTNLQNHMRSHDESAPACVACDTPGSALTLAGHGGALTGCGGALAGRGGALTGRGGALTGRGGALAGRGGARAKPFACQVCGKRYTRNFSLKVHARTHTGDKPFACSVCSGTFSCYQYLKAHRRRHQADETDGYLDAYKGVLERTLKKNKMVQTNE